MNADSIATELLPCPFCGSPYTCKDSTYSDWCEISCPQCGAEIGSRLEADAIAAWNKRQQQAGTWLPVHPCDYSKLSGNYDVIPLELIVGADGSYDIDGELPENLRLCQLAPAGMDTPDGEGWWAFDGNDLNDRLVVNIARWEVHDTEYHYWWSEDDFYKMVTVIEDFKAAYSGKWFRLHMPWGAQAKEARP